MSRIKLYKNHSRKNVWNKNLTNATNYINITFKENVDILNPVIKLVYNSNYLGFNYVYIEDFDRYYFIEKTELINKTYVCYCHVDVIQTYKNSIKECNATAIRCADSNFYNKFLNDEKYLGYQDTNIQIKKFSESFSKDSSYVLVIGG